MISNDIGNREGLHLVNGSFKKTWSLKMWDIISAVIDLIQAVLDYFL